MPVNWKYWSMDNPWDCILLLKSSSIWRHCVISIASGISICAFSITLSTAASSFARFASFAFLSSRFVFTCSLYSASVSNSETSFAKSSSSSGSSFASIFLTAHLKIASLPASSFAWYSSGNVTFTSTSSPTLAPTSCSSNPGINVLEPSVRGYSVACPPSKGTPSTDPSKSIVTISFNWAARSSTLIVLEFFSCSFLSSASTSSSVTVISVFGTSTPL